MRELHKDTTPFSPSEGRFCSVCGEPLNQLEVADDLVIQKTLGYGSKFDETEHRIEFCHKCFDTLLDSCKRPTLVRDLG